MKTKKIISIMAIVSMLLMSCAPSQKTIDNILPDYNRRMYSIADLIPYTYKEVRNAQALYGIELTDFFVMNTSTEAEAKRVTKEQKENFYSELRYRNTNYKLLRQRLAMYIEDEIKPREEKEAERQKEYDEYYKIPTAKGANVIKQYNKGKLQGMPLMSIKVDLSTATMSEIDDIYSEAECDIFRPVVIKQNDYDKLKFGDTINLTVPATTSDAYCKITKVVKCEYIATDSLMYINDEGKNDYYFIAQVDGINDERRILDYYGHTVEIFVERKPLQFMKYAKVARANEPQRLMSSITNDTLLSYDFDRIAVRALSGGYLVYDYKDYIYANSVSTNLKGYITSLYHYDNQRIDNEFYNTLN